MSQCKKRIIQLVFRSTVGLQHQKKAGGNAVCHFDLTSYFQAECELMTCMQAVGISNR